MINSIRILGAVCFSLAMSFAFASDPFPKEGTDYLTLKNPQPASFSSKVEVIEFFGYFCKHCFSFEPALDEWAKKQQRNADFRRVHVRFGERMILQQQLFFALSAMDPGSTALHHKAFEHTHVLRQPLRTESQMSAFIRQNGQSSEKFMELLRSPQVRALSDEAAQLQARFQIDGVPAIVIDGRFITSLAIVSQGDPSLRTAKEVQTKTILIMDRLVERILRERAGPQRPRTSKSRNN